MKSDINIRAYDGLYCEYILGGLLYCCFLGFLFFIFMRFK